MLYIILGIIGIIGLMLIIIYNTLIQAKMRVDEAFATMDVYLKKRFDLVPNLVESCKGYMKHESETLKNLVELRNSVLDCKNEKQKLKAEAELSNGISKIFALAENYPDLKANTNFISLNEQMAKTEEDIAQARKYYNAVVRIYNTKVCLFPTNIFAGMLGFSQREMFEISETERASIRISFDD